MAPKTAATRKAAPKKTTKAPAKVTRAAAPVVKKAAAKAAPKAAPKVYSLELSSGGDVMTWSFSTKAARDGALVKLQRRSTCTAPVSAMRPLRFATTDGEKIAGYVKYAAEK